MRSALPRELHGLRDEDGTWRVPLVEFRGARPLRGLDRALPALPCDMHPVAVRRWLANPDPDLELAGEPASPIAWLASGGDPALVAAIAQGM